jgi:chemotaxis protein histidine kinase CheA
MSENINYCDYYGALRESITIVNDNMKKTSISSVVCLDIIDFLKKSDSEQKAIKKQFDDLIALAVVDIPEKDRLIVDTGHGAIITCSGPLENALEDALFIALTIRDEVLNRNSASENPLYLLMGINLGSVKVAENANVNEPPNIVGEGLVEAQRIMSFAKPNQILVSRAYYEMASKLTLEIAQMFEKYDMHAYEHDIYAVRLLNEKAAPVENVMPIPGNAAIEEESAEKSDTNWGVYILPVLLALAMLYALTKWMNAENAEESAIEPALTESMSLETAEDEMAVESVLDEALTEEQEAADQDATNQEAINEDQADQSNAAAKKVTKQKETKKKATEKKAVKKTVSTQKPSAKKASTHQSTVTPEPAESEPEKPAEEKSGWDKFTESIGQGAETECTQAQKALNQCN